MLFQLAHYLFKKIIVKKIHIERNIISKSLELLRDSCVISSQSAWASFSGHFKVTPSQILFQDSLQLDDIKSLAQNITEERIIGIGGGRVLDCAKAIARIGKKRCILIPTILSTTAWLNLGASLKQGVQVLHFYGIFDRVLVDPVFIALAPQALNIGGIADILCGFNSLSDWILAKEWKGERMPKKALKSVLEFCNGLKDHLDSYLPITPSSIEFIAHKFIEALGLCWGFLSGRPIEGSEHFLYYALEELHDKPMNHGAIIALNTLVCLYIKGKDALIEASVLKTFYDKIGLSYKLSTLNIPLETYKKALQLMGEFVQKRKLGFSIWNLNPLIDDDILRNIFS